MAAVERACDRSSAVVRLSLKRRVNTLATIASVAPLLGLAGTVEGLNGSFPGVGADWATILGAIFGYLSQSFAPTALGLLVGISAYWAYRHLTSEVELLAFEMRGATLQLMNDISRLY